MAGLIDKLRWHWETKRTRLLWGWRLGALGRGAIIEPGVEVKGARAVRIGPGARICKGATLLSLCKEDEYLSIGSNTYVCGRTILDSAGGCLDIGSDVFIGPDTHMAGQGGCKIGDDCQIAAFCYIIAANHNFEDRSIPIRLQGSTCKGIEIGEDCWLGVGVTVLDGVRIGRGCVLAARAVVTKSLDDCLVVAGIPAKVLKTRGQGEADFGKNAGSE